MCIRRYFIDLVSIPSPGIFPLKIYKLPSKKFGDCSPKKKTKVTPLYSLLPMEFSCAFFGCPGCGCWNADSHSSCSSGLGRLFLWVSIVVTGLTGSILEELGWHNTSQQNYSWQGCADGNAYLCHLKPTRDTRIWAITINRKNLQHFLVTHTQVHWVCLVKDLQSALRPSTKYSAFKHVEVNSSSA